MTLVLQEYKAQMKNPMIRSNAIKLKPNLFLNIFLKYSNVLYTFWFHFMQNSGKYGKKNLKKCYCV